VALTDPVVEAWAAVAEYRARKELRSVGTQRHDSKLTPKNKVEKFDQN
jgi:hypothetical protein